MSLFKKPTRPPDPFAGLTAEQIGERITAWGVEYFTKYPHEFRSPGHAVQFILDQYATDFDSATFNASTVTEPPTTETRP